MKNMMKKTLLALMIILLFVGSAAAAYYPTKQEAYYKYRYPTPTITPKPCPTCPTPTPCPTCPACPAVTDNVAYYSYKVMVVDGIDQEAIRHALAYIPNVFSYTLVPEDSSKYYFDTNGYARPTESRTIVIFDGNKHGYTKGQATGYYLGQGKATIVYLGQEPYKLSWLIQHECNHEALGGTSINIDSKNTYLTGWNNWMGSMTLGYYATDSTAWISGGWIRLKGDYFTSAIMGIG